MIYDVIIKLAKMSLRVTIFTSTAVYFFRTDEFSRSLVDNWTTLFFLFFCLDHLYLEHNRQHSLHCSSGKIFCRSGLHNFILVIVCVHRRSQDFVWGCTFSYQKSWRPFFNPPSKNCPKIDSCSDWGALRVLGVNLHIFPVNYAWKFFFTALGVQVHPLHPLVTPMFVWAVGLGRRE